MDSQTMRAAVADNPARDRFELAVGGTVAFVDYRRSGDVLIVPHTEVPRALEGRGVGTALVLGTLDRVREAGRKVSPRCGFFARVVMRHPDQRDLLA